MVRKINSIKQLIFQTYKVHDREKIVAQKYPYKTGHIREIILKVFIGYALLSKGTFYYQCTIYSSTIKLCKYNIS